MDDEIKNTDPDPAPVAEETGQSQDRPGKVILSDGRHVGPNDQVSVAPWDFTAPAMLNEGALNELREMHERLARRLAGRLTLFLRADFELKLSDVKVESYAEAIRKSAGLSHYAIFKAAALPGLGYLETGVRLALAVSNSVLGGRGAAPDIERPLTEIEQDLFTGFVEEILRGWSSQWKSEPTLNAALAGHEAKAESVSICDDDVPVLICAMDAIYRGCESHLRVVAPVYMIEPLLRRLEAERKAKRGVARPTQKSTTLSPRQSGIPVDLHAEWRLGEHEIREVCSWRPGDVIELPPGIFERTVLRIPGSAAFLCDAGVEDGKIAVAVKETLKS